MTLGQAIRRIRENSNQTLREMGAALGVSHVHVCNLESGKVEPSLKLLMQFRTYYNQDPYIMAAESAKPFTKETS